MSRAPGGRLGAALYGLRMGLALSATGLYAALVVNALLELSAWWPVLVGAVALEGGVAAVAYAAAVVRPERVPHRWPGYVGMWAAALVLVNSLFISFPLLLVAALGLWGGPRERAG